MSDTTSLLFGLDDHTVIEVTALPGCAELDPGVRVVIESADREAACPACGVMSRRVKDRPLRRVKDLPASGQRVALWLRGRRLVCTQSRCPRRSFTQTSGAIPSRSRLTSRLRTGMATSIARSNRAVSEVAREHQVAWGTAHAALVQAAVAWLPTPEPTRVLGIDETRARSVRWIHHDHGWRRSDPWMTSFVNADPTMPGRLLGLSPGRSGACVKTWLGAQTAEFRAGIEVVVIDPSAPYASGIRTALPHAAIAVDHWHLVKLANDMLTQVRQRVVREQHGRRGLATDRVWAHRRMLLTAGERLSMKQLTRLKLVLATEDPTDEIGAAWGCKERLRMLLNSPPDPRIIRTRLWDFYLACELADLPETSRLATTIQTWWPHVLTYLLLGVTNARTEGFNRIIKQVKRTGCGYRNMINYERRILTHIALTRVA